LPSLLDLLHNGDDPEPEIEPPHALLAAVKAEGGRRRVGRHRRTAGLALLGLVVVGVPVAVSQGGDRTDRRTVDVAADGGGGSTSGGGALEPISDPAALPAVDPVPPATTVPPAEPEPTLPPAAPTPPTTTAPVPVTTAPAPAVPGPVGATTTTTAASCRNSREPVCGDFRWDPAPAANQPLSASFTTAPTTAVAGQPVAFAVTWADGDAALSFERLSTDGTALASSCSLLPRHGSWTPPARVPSSGTLSYSPIFPAAGTYKVVVSLSTSDCSSPYASNTQVEVEVNVTAAPQ